MKKMSKKIILLGLILAVMLPTAAQVTDPEATLKSTDTKATDDGWHFGGVTNLNFSQLYLSNWAAGGENSYALNGLVSLFASYKKKSLTWDNNLDMGYGFMNQYESELGRRKTDDKFDFTSKVGYKAFSDFYYSGLMNFKTQFDQGLDYKSDPINGEKISDFMAPAYLTAALGLSYQPNKYFNAFLAPFTGRLTIVNDATLTKKYSLEPGNTTRMEFGGYIRTIYSRNDFEAEFLKNVTLTSKLDLFSNYLDNPQFKKIDVNWEVLIALKVNKYLSVNINTNLVWDYDVKFKQADGITEKEKLQFKELLGVGFSYNF